MKDISEMKENSGLKKESEMKKTGKMKIVWKIILITTAAGLVLSILGLALGASRVLYVDRSGLHVTGSGVSHITEWGLEAFKNIQIDAGLSDIEFISSDKYGIDLYGDNMEWNWTLENGLLRITHDRGTRLQVMNLDFISTERNHVKIFLPVDTNLETVDIKTSSGNIKLSYIQTERLEATTSFGDINLSNITSDNMKISVSSGKFTGKNLDAQSLTYTSSFGDGQFQSVKATNFTADSSSGNLNLIGCDLGDMNIKTNFGDITAYGLISTGANIQARSGGINITGDISGENIINTSFGDIKLTMGGRREDYSFDITVRFGDITIDGERLRDQGSFVSSPVQQNHFIISSSSGDIRMNFEG